MRLTGAEALRQGDRSNGGGGFESSAENHENGKIRDYWVRDDGAGVCERGGAVVPLVEAGGPTGDCLDLQPERWGV